MLDYKPYLSTIKNLFPMPHVMAKVMGMMENPNAEIQDMADILLTDPSIVSDIVRYSNSAWYGYDEQTANLREALQRIGLEELLHFVGLSLTSRLYQKELSHYRIPPELFWESALAGACLMQNLAAINGQEKDEAYLAGLMREVGMIVIDYILTDKMIRRQWDCYTPLRQWEKQTCGFDHCDAGAALLGNWQFPDTVCSAVRNQWNEAEASPPLARMLKLNNLLLEKTCGDFSSPTGDWDPLLPVAEAAEIPIDDILPAIEASKETFEKLRSIC